MDPADRECAVLWVTSAGTPSPTATFRSAAKRSTATAVKSFKKATTPTRMRFYYNLVLTWSSNLLLFLQAQSNVNVMFV